MPDILTHLLCADESSKNLNEDLKKIIKDHQKIYNLGAQGPDLFFYYKVYPWQDAHNVDRFADMIHGQSTSDFFMNAAMNIKRNIHHDPMGFFKAKHYTDTHRQFAYLAGFLTHYATDTICHPYIFYFSGINASYNHKYLECIIDTLMMDIYDARKNKLHKTGSAIKPEKQDRHIVSDFLSKTIYETYKERVEADTIEHAIKDMSIVMKVMYDPAKIKRRAFKTIDKFAKAKGKITTATYPAPYDEQTDYLNLQHRTWFHPTDDSIAYTKSFLECFKEAVEYGHQLISDLSLYIVGQLDYQTFADRIGDKLYDTGRHYSKGSEMFYADPILDYKKVFNIK